MNYWSWNNIDGSWNYIPNPEKGSTSMTFCGDNA